MNSEIDRDVASRFLDSLMEDYDFTLPPKAYCILRVALSTEAQPEVTGAVARVDDLERGGRVRALALGLSLDAPLYPPSAIEAAVREKLEEVVNMIEHTPSLKDPDDTARLIQNKVRALMDT